jgi:hypothetical protein
MFFFFSSFSLVIKYLIFNFYKKKVKNKYFHFGKEELNQFKNFLEITCPPPSPAKIVFFIKQFQNNFIQNTDLGERI